MKDTKVTIIGLGYVGLTLGVALASRGIKVYGVEKRKEVVDLTNAGIPHFSENGLADVLKKVVSDKLFIAKNFISDVDPTDYYVITVGTPLDASTHLPRLDMIKDAASEVASRFKNGATVILRSTVQIGTTRNVVKPILDESKIDYNLAMCPERTLEGKALTELFELPQIIGPYNSEAGEIASKLFGVLTKTTVLVKSPETAEMIKLIDNTSRDVNFAFANEVARACVSLGIDAYDVINYGKLGYLRTNVALPGLVGGPCLEKDPHILMHSLKDFSIDLEITRASRLINERQPQETIETVFNIAKSKKLNQENIKIAVLGMAFKGVPETDDLRGSMSLKVVDEIKKYNVNEIRIFDPVIGLNFQQQYIENLKVCENFEDAISGVNIVIIANNHKFFSKKTIEKYKSSMNEVSFVYDYWNTLSNESELDKKNFYYSVGNINL